VFLRRVPSTTTTTTISTKEPAMAEILFVTWDGGGNVPPALGIAEALTARGHTVRFVGHPGQRPALEAAGFEVAPSRHAREFSALDSNSPPALVAMFGDRGLGRDVVAALADRDADVIVVDCLLFGVMDELTRAGRQYVVLEHLYDAYLTGGWLKGPMGWGMRLKRLHPTRALTTARLRLVTSVPSLDPASGRGGLTYVGPVSPVASGRVDRAERADTDPMVLVSLSTYRFPRMTQCLQAILDACADLDARVVVTTGPVVEPSDLHVPANAEVHRFVPHVELMPRASLVIGHGGHGTTMQALAHDLPLVLMPMHPMLDQPLVARSVEAAGAGRVVRKKATAQELRPVIASLLGDGPHRAAAARLGAEIRALPGAAGAAALIEGFVSNGAVATPRP
jgi:UDP:flavonoid glycosyltransferase YjiC (YdhE family)